MFNPSKIPDWLGTAPQWFLLVAVVVAIIKIIPVWRQQTLNKEVSDVSGYREEVASLRAELKSCEEDCAKALRESQAEIRGLHEDLWGMRKQNIAEQISLINIILKTVDAPELHGLLSVLESIKGRLSLAAVVDNEQKESASVQRP